MSQKLGFIFLAPLTSFLILGCGNKKEENIFKSQNCINTATAASVNGCLNFVEGQTSARSYVLRCSAAFISQGIDESAIVDAIRNIEGKDSGNPTTPAIAALAMESTEISNQALEDCTKSESKSLAALANFANLSTAMTAVLGVVGDNPTQAEIEALIASYDPNNPPSPADKEALGAAVIASQDSLCNTKNGLFKGTKACTDINSAIQANPNNASAVADALIGNINS